MSEVDSSPRTVNLLIETLPDLKKFFKICRDAGVTDASAQGMTFKFGDLPRGQSDSLAEESAEPYAGFPDGVVSNEVLAMWSVRPAGGPPPANREEG